MGGLAKVPREYAKTGYLVYFQYGFTPHHAEEAVEVTAPIRSDKVTAQKVRWLWRERIPRGMITVVAGRPDQGKGLFGAHLVAYASKRNVNSLFSAAEDSHSHMTKPRLVAAGARLDKVLLWRFSLPNDQLELFELIIKAKIGLIVIDPLAAHLSGGISRHSDNIRTVLTPLSSLIEKTGTSVVIIEHALKRVPANGDLLGVIGGSGSGLTAAARAAFVFGTDPGDEDKRVLAPAKFNIGPKPDACSFEIDVSEIEGIGEMPLLIYEDSVPGFDAMKMFSKPSSHGIVGRPPDKRAAAAEWITNYLANAGGPVLSKTIQEDAKQYGMSTKTLRRAADDQGIVRNPSSGPNCKWDLPAGLKKLLGITDAPVPAPPAPSDRIPKAAAGGEFDDVLKGIEAMLKDDSEKDKTDE